MSHACCLCSGLRGITFNTMENIFIILNSDRSRFGDLVNRFRDGNPEVVNADIDRLKTLLEAIDSCSHIFNDLLTTKPSALRGSAPKLETIPFPPPKSNFPKTTARPRGAQSRYPPMRPNWDSVTGLSKDDKVFCACFQSNTRAQVCLPLAHAVLVVSNDPEEAQQIIATYAEKKKTWEEAKKNAPTDPKPRGQCATSSKRSPLLTVLVKPPPLATARPKYWGTLGSDSDEDAEFRSEIDLKHPQEHRESTDTSEATKGVVIDNLANIKNINNNYYPSARRFFTNCSSPRRQPNLTPTIITSVLTAAATKALSKLGHCRYKCITK